MNMEYSYVDYETEWDEKTKVLTIPLFSFLCCVTMSCHYLLIDGLQQDITKLNFVVPLIDSSTVEEDQQLNVWAVNEG
jgi:hypothetical protein